MSSFDVNNKLSYSQEKKLKYRARKIWLSEKFKFVSKASYLSILMGFIVIKYHKTLLELIKIYQNNIRIRSYKILELNKTKLKNCNK